MVSGIPLLVIDGKIDSDVFKKKTAFYTNPHARTAIGTKLDGTIIIVVAEHHYTRDLATVTMGEVRSLIKEKDKILAQKYHKSTNELTLVELNEILKDELASPNGAKGLTIIELAQFLKDKGCNDALNLDGGGSSTLWIDGKVINNTIGDIDEGNSLKKIRGVSDAIVFIPK